MPDVLALVLDVDDTLYLERDFVRSGFEHIERWLAKEHDVYGVGDRAWALFSEGVRRTTLGDALSAIIGDQSLLAECIEQYRAHPPAIALLRDADELLSHATARKIELAVVTDGPAVSQWNKCRALGLTRLIERIVVTADLGTSKPDPAAFQAAARGWTVPAASVLYVADNPAKDFAGPLSLGWQVLRVRRPGSLHESVSTPPGVREVSDLSDLTSSLRSRHSRPQGGRP